MAAAFRVGRAWPLGTIVIVLLSQVCHCAYTSLNASPAHLHQTQLLHSAAHHPLAYHNPYQQHPSQSANLQQLQHQHQYHNHPSQYSHFQLNQLPHRPPYSSLQPPRQQAPQYGPSPATHQYQHQHQTHSFQPQHQLQHQPQAGQHHQPSSGRETYEELLSSGTHTLEGPLESSGGAGQQQSPEAARDHCRDLISLTLLSFRDSSPDERASEEIDCSHLRQQIAAAAAANHGDHHGHSRQRNSQVPMAPHPPSRPSQSVETETRATNSAADPFDELPLAPAYSRPPSITINGRQFQPPFVVTADNFTSTTTTTTTTPPPPPPTSWQPRSANYVNQMQQLLIQQQVSQQRQRQSEQEALLRQHYQQHQLASPTSTTSTTTMTPPSPTTTYESTFFETTLDPTTTTTTAAPPPTRATISTTSTSTTTTTPTTTTTGRAPVATTPAPPRHPGIRVGPNRRRAKAKILAARLTGGSTTSTTTTTTTTTTSTTAKPSSLADYADGTEASTDYYDEYEDQGAGAATTTTTTTTTPRPNRRAGRKPKRRFTTTSTSPRPSTTTTTLSPGYQPRPDGRVIDYMADPNFPRELKGADLTNYPFYISVPEKIDFECKGRHDGYYTNIDLHCQIYHHCALGNRYDFLCPNYTLFDQTTFTCRFINTVDCVGSEKHFDRNNALYVEKDEDKGPAEKPAVAGSSPAPAPASATSPAPASTQAPASGSSAPKLSIPLQRAPAGQQPASSQSLVVEPAHARQARQRRLAAPPDGGASNR